MSAHVFHSDDHGGYFHAMGEAFNNHAFRWIEDHHPAKHVVTTKKAAMDDGKPAELVRTFNAVPDDFGNLVEVA